VAVGQQSRPGEARDITELNRDLLAHKELGQVEELWWESSFDGRRIQGWIIRPPGFDPAQRYPLVLEIHGGPFANYGPRFTAELQLYAAAGYVVLYTNPRGSSSYGQEFGNLIHHAYPGQDYDDLMSGVDAVIERGYVDPDRLYVTGGSGGGVLSAWIVGKTDRFRAAVVQKPVINWTSFVLYADNPATAIRRFEDPEGDDHGPNQTDGSGNPVEGLYYEYPTNLVFLPGSFDITDFEVFADGDRIVFRTYLRDLVNHRDPSAADWGAPQPSEQTCPGEYRTDLNLQKIDIYIDASEGEGSTSGFPNRYVDIATVDAWDYAISAEGWGKWFVVSNGSNSIANWDLYKNDSDISMCDDYVEDYVDVSVNRALLGLGEGDTSEILKWDIIVCVSSHDGESNDQNLGAIRWVNANTSEWQMGGGRDSEGGRDRDANIVDVATSAGEGHEPGRTQEEMLDYTTAAATERFDANKVACVLEASFAVDTSPPIISEFASDEELEFVPWEALDGAPAVFWTTITDVTGIGAARFHWYPVGQPALRDSVEMVNLTGDVWAADIAREDITAGTSVVELNKVGDARVVEGWIFAKDSSDSANQIKSPTYTFGVPEPWSSHQTLSVPDTLGQEEERSLVFQDGTVLLLTGADLPGSEELLDFTVTPVASSMVDVSNIRDDMEFVGVARDVTGEYGDGAPLALMDFPLLMLHYPQYEVGVLDEQNFGLFQWIADSERWVLKGGAGNPTGNTVIGEMGDYGLYGVFFWDALDVGGSDGLSGVLAEPNPFSPNGDGVYDEMDITFYLGREADYVNIEFYDLEGRLARRLVFQAATDYTGRAPVRISWDGTDEEGNVVPYGIYVMRVEAKFKTEPTFERVNRPIVVIK